MTYILTFLGVMVAMIIADICWTYYFIKVEERKALAAGIWSSLITISGSFITTSYVHDRSLVLAAVIGAFIGTAGTVYFKKKK
jgi:peptidoglycan biosynthesis protein MviN/MurJ (putative lipid II flippase)